MTRYHQVEEVKIEHGVLSLTVDGRKILAKLRDISPTLAVSDEKSMLVFEVSPSGYGIHWPLLDEDISIDALLGITHSPTEWKKSA